MSCDLQRTAYVLVIGIIVNSFFGHALAHLPQEVHVASLMTGRFSSFMVIAPKGQMRAQVPYPMQPYSHALGPHRSALAAVQS